jgi:hypothetical protein
MISSGRNGVKDATKEPNDPYFASNNCKGVIRVNVSFFDKASTTIASQKDSCSS